MALTQEDVSSSQPIALIQTKSFWVQTVQIALVVAKFIGISTGTIDVNGVADALLDLSLGVTALIGMYTRYVATKKVTGILKPAPVFGSSSMLQPPIPKG